MCKSKSGHFAWEVLTKSLTFILTQKSKNLDFDDPCHEKNTSNGCLNPTLRPSRPSRGALKRYQKIIEKPIQKPFFFRLPKILVFAIYIYIAFWSNPPASRSVRIRLPSLPQPGLTLEREARLIIKTILR